MKPCLGAIRERDGNIAMMTLYRRHRLNDITRDEVTGGPTVEESLNIGTPGPMQETSGDLREV